MAVGLALLVSADLVAIQQFDHALQELSITPDVCREIPAAVGLLNRRKFDAVIVDLQLGEQSGLILDEVHLPSSNRTAVTFGIGDKDAAETVVFRKKSQFVFERPLSAQSIDKTLKPAYGLILRERRRYFRCPTSLPVIIQREGRHEIPCNSVNISEGVWREHAGSAPSRRKCPRPKQPRFRLETESYEHLCQEVLRRGSWRCQSYRTTSSFEVHHQQHRSQSGDYSARNLITLCAACHKNVHRGTLRLARASATPRSVRGMSFRNCNATDQDRNPCLSSHYIS